MRGPRPESDCALASVSSEQDGTRFRCRVDRAKAHTHYEGESSSLVPQFSVVVYEHPGYGPRI